VGPAKTLCLASCSRRPCRVRTDDGPNPGPDADLNTVPPSAIIGGDAVPVAGREPGIT
jgi:hypothetical protein